MIVTLECTDPQRYILTVSEHKVGDLFYLIILDTEENTVHSKSTLGDRHSTISLVGDVLLKELDSFVIKEGYSKEYLINELKRSNPELFI